MEKTNFFSFRALQFLEDFNPNHLGIYFSLLLHFIILLFAIGLPQFFQPKQIAIPNIIPIEILNVTEVTNLTKNENKNQKTISEKKIMKQKKFNSSENTEIKKIELREKPKITKKELVDESLLIKNQNSQSIDLKEKQILKTQSNELFQSNKNIETLEINKIKPKLKPKPTEKINKQSDIDLIPKPQTKPEPDFSIASMLKDLRNEKSNNIIQEELKEEVDEIVNESNKNEEQVTLSISEIDLLRQQLSSCWNAPAGAVIEKGMKVRVSAKIQQNRRVIENSVRIVDTNIPISNSFYGPITESAMRTLLNPECTPLKLPIDKYNLWKNLTITFDYSIMKGYS